MERVETIRLSGFVLSIMLALVTSTFLQAQTDNSPPVSGFTPPAQQPPGIESRPETLPIPPTSVWSRSGVSNVEVDQGHSVAEMMPQSLSVLDETNMTYTPWVDETEIDPLKVGSMLAQGSKVYTSSGEQLDLNQEVLRQPTVLIYYRGGWDPFCNLQLNELRKSVAPLASKGYQILAVSTDTLAALQEFEHNHQYDYRLLVDPDLSLASALGIKYKVRRQYIDHLASKPGGVDLQAQNGGYLVTPAAMVFDPNGKIYFIYTNNDYTMRVNQEALLSAATRALQPLKLLNKNHTATGYLIALGLR